jgi:hypothetical protein
MSNDLAHLANGTGRAVVQTRAANPATVNQARLSD